jgi:hypothetical protein
MRLEERIKSYATILAQLNELIQLRQEFQRAQQLTSNSPRRTKTRRRNGRRRANTLTSFGAALSRDTSIHRTR